MSYPYIPPLPAAETKDVNDDGYSDVIIAAYGADEAYVFYGAPTFASTTYALNTLSGTDGFAMVVGNDGDEITVAGVGVRIEDRHLVMYAVGREVLRKFSRQR